MKTALDKIIDYKKNEVAALKRQRSLSSLLDSAKAASPVRGFKARLDAVVQTGQNALICELKRKSPSAGDIMPGADPLVVAKDYEKGGAACLSVLTDFPSFGGKLEDLIAVRKTVSLPVLRKDFMIDPIQIAEARAHHADCILLILAALDDGLAAELQAFAIELGLDVLTEVHDEAELKRAHKLGADLIGINNRDLKRMVTDLAVSEALANGDVTHGMISESGVKTASDIIRLRSSGFKRFLIGESLMKETDRESATHALVMAC